MEMTYSFASHGPSNQNEGIKIEFLHADNLIFTTVLQTSRPCACKCFMTEISKKLCKLFIPAIYLHTYVTTCTIVMYVVMYVVT